uniref:Killer cell lectin-like receptor subfamily F member 2 n=1 Tax=Geotrypetes seraphini TaxID=260995 RepID=A0A6P8S7Q9_GEOSA|nr:killer cell lectin-like receptor subfamily F member 2 [Geotrypetes seraphini]
MAALMFLDHKCPTNADLNQTQTGSDLQDKLEKFQKWEVLRDQYFCPEDWRPWRGNCYFVSKEITNYLTSMRDCRSRNSRLAPLNNPKDLESIKITSHDYYWVIYKSSDKHGTWPSDTETRNPTADASSSCATLAINAVYPTDCSEQHRWICERPSVELQLGQDYNFTVLSFNGTKYTGVTKERLRKPQV